MNPNILRTGFQEGKASVPPITPTLRTMAKQSKLYTRSLNYLETNIPGNRDNPHKKSNIVMKSNISFWLLTATVSLLTLSTSCSKTEWRQTEEGYYFYDRTQSNRQYSWSGGSVGGVIHGNGILITYNRNKSIIGKKNCSALYGATDSKYYTDSRQGKYLGEGKNKKGYKKPKGFGVLIIDHDYPDNVKDLTEFAINKEWIDSHQSVYIGNFKRGLFSGFGKLYEKNLLFYEGYWKKGKKSSVGKEYVNGILSYSGYFKHGNRNGLGEEFAKRTDADTIYLKYSGKWKDNLYDGYGRLYNEHILIYEGNWRKGKYNGKGRLYENGECVEGKWEDGINSDIYSRSLLDQALTYFGHEPTNETLEYTNLQLAENDREFIDGLMNEIHTKVETEISRNVDKRFGFWGVFRMYYQYIFTSNVKRIKKAEKAFCKGLDPDDLTKEINAKINYYNEINNGNLSYIKELDAIPELSIVNSDLAFKVLDREAMEATDGLIGILLEIITFCILILLIHFLIKICNLILFASLPNWLFDLVLVTISFIAAIVILFAYGNPVMTQMQSEIQQMLIYNFQLYIDSQNIIQQITA